MMSILDQFNEESGDITTKKSNFFKFEKGENKVRILCEGSVIGTHFINNKGFACYGKSKGCPRHDEGAPQKNGQPQEPSVKYCTYILDRADGGIKVVDLPYTIIKRVDELQKDEDWTFTEYPMPYDIKITFAGRDAAPVDMYKVLASPNKSPLTPEQNAELERLLRDHNPKDIVAKKKANQLQEDQNNGLWKEPVGISEEDKIKIQQLREQASKNKSEPDMRIDESDRDIDPDDIPF